MPTATRIAGRAAAKPWVSSRATRTALLRLSPGGAATVTCTATGHSPGSASALFSYRPRPQIDTVTATLTPTSACTAITPDERVDAAYRCTIAQGTTIAAKLAVTADYAAISADWDTTGGTATATITAGRQPAADTHTTAIDVNCIRLACADHLGTLAAGRTTRSGTVVADTACVSSYRSPGSHYARRHTFTLDSPVWVDIDLEAGLEHLAHQIVQLADVTGQRHALGTGLSDQLLGPVLHHHPVDGLGRRHRRPLKISYRHDSPRPQAPSRGLSDHIWIHTLSDRRARCVSALRDARASGQPSLADSAGTVAEFRAPSASRRKDT